MRRAVVVLAAVASCVALFPGTASAAGPRVLLVSFPGVTWSDVRAADTPALDRLVARGAAGALAARTVTGRPNVERGYLTLGAGNRAYVAATDPAGNAAYEADARVEAGTAADALRRRMGDTRPAGIVQLGAARLQSLQDAGLYGARAGALGEALARGGVRRAVVSASDTALEPAGPETTHRAAVMALMDHEGSLDTGALDGLLRSEASAPFGVAVDAERFVDAVVDAFRTADVVLADPGETVRADEFVNSVPPGRLARMRIGAIERSDRVLGALLDAVPRGTVVIAFAPSPPSYAGADNHLTPVVAWGPGFERGWLRSATTEQDGQVTLTDLAPTVLRLRGIEPGTEMTGTPMRSVRDAGSDRPAELEELDEASVFRERFSVAVFYVLAVLLSLLAVLAFVVFLGGFERAFGVLVAVAYLGLAIFPAAHVVRAIEYWRFGQIGAHIALYLIAAALAVLAWRLPGPRWVGGAALLCGSALMFTWDFFLRGPLQVNGIFGHSPVVAGRFYGAGNVGVTIAYSSAVLGLMAVGEMRRWRTPPWWVAVLFALAVASVGLPQFGADFGGMATGVAAFVTTFTLARRKRIGWRWVAGVAALAVALTAAATAIDLMRPPEVQTHLGRFGATVVDGGFEAFSTIVLRKAASQFGSVGVTRWTYVIPVGVAVVGLLLLQPRGVLRAVLPQRRMLLAGLWGVLVVGVVGFALNDSGIAIPAVALAHAVPFLVLFAVETVSPRPQRAT